MRNEDILAHWRTRAEPTTLFADNALLAYGFQPATRAFLVQVGLPVQAAPFLSFSQHDNPARGGFYQVQQQYDLANSFARYIAIGSDGEGNPIVINIQQQDRIEWLDHEDDFAPHYVNASVQTLASCLVVYDQFIEQVQQAEGEDAYLDAQFTDSQFAALRERLLAEDAQVIEEGGLWQIELTNLLANREHYRTQ
jgi:hypothetical protein